ncbi:MAG: hypothetical protein JWR19_524, partial [Pedosphaera sp.]|nr:hypothetical protein [Pedosphaera sp.]
ADFTITGSGISVVLKNAAMAEHGFMFGREPLRIGEVAWQTTRAFTAGVPGAVATVS